MPLCARLELPSTRATAGGARRDHREGRVETCGSARGPLEPKVNVLEALHLWLGCRRGCRGYPGAQPLVAQRPSAAGSLFFVGNRKDTGCGMERREGPGLTLTLTYAACAVVCMMRCDDAVCCCCSCAVAAAAGKGEPSSPKAGSRSFTHAASSLLIPTPARARVLVVPQNRDSCRPLWLRAICLSFHSHHRAHLFTPDLRYHRCCHHHLLLLLSYVPLDVTALSIAAGWSVKQSCFEIGAFSTPPAPHLPRPFAPPLPLDRPSGSRERSQLNS